VLLPNLESLQRFPRPVCASIALATTVIWIAEAFIIGLRRAVSRGPSLGYSTADANDLYSLSEGKIYFIKLTQNNQTCCTLCTTNELWLILSLFKINSPLGIEVYYLFSNVLKWCSNTKRRPHQSSRNVLIPLVAIQKGERVEKKKIDIWHRCLKHSSTLQFFF